MASAAHPPALICGPSRTRCHALGSQTGLIAGFRVGEEYPTESAVLQAGDVLVFYTDGVTEARRRKTMFGMERLARVIEQNAARDAQEIAAAVYAAVADHTGGTLTDDIALLVLKAV